MTARTGIWHWERKDQTGTEQPVDLVQIWIVPNQLGLTPGYEQLNLSRVDFEGKQAVVASGLPEHKHAIAMLSGALPHETCRRRFRWWRALHAL